MTERIGDWMQTFTGKQFWPLDARVEEVFIEDIAHALAMNCRYGGHAIRFYSVAEHSCLMADWAWRNGYSVDVQKWCLLHDATEAYLVDVPRPIKPFLTNYKAIENALMSIIAERFNLSEEPEEIKDIDFRMLATERFQNMARCDAEWNLPKNPLNCKLQYWNPDMAEAQFLSAFKILWKDS